MKKLIFIIFYLVCFCYQVLFTLVMQAYHQCRLKLVGRDTEKYKAQLATLIVASIGAFGVWYYYICL